MLDAEAYPVIGQVIRKDCGQLGLSPMPEAGRHGILLLVERMARPKASLAIGGGEVRLALDGVVERLLNRPHPDIHGALDLGVVIDARFRPITDPMEAAFTCHEIVSRRGPAWNQRT